eukprot:5431209-Ditylum_brightwellii.AAC.1
MDKAILKKSNNYNLGVSQDGECTVAYFQQQPMKNQCVYLDQTEDLWKECTDIKSRKEIKQEISQVSECYEMWSAYSDAQLCNHTFEDCNTGYKPSNDSDNGDCTQNEHTDLNQSISKDRELHVTVNHFSMMGQSEFKTIMYCPKHVPFDMFEKGFNHIIMNN